MSSISRNSQIEDRSIVIQDTSRDLLESHVKFLKKGNHRGKDTISTFKDFSRRLSPVLEESDLKENVGIRGSVSEFLAPAGQYYSCETVAINTEKQLTYDIKMELNALFSIDAGDLNNLNPFISQYKALKLANCSDKDMKNFRETIVAVVTNVLLRSIADNKIQLAIQCYNKFLEFGIESDAVNQLFVEWIIKDSNNQVDNLILNEFISKCILDKDLRLLSTLFSLLKKHSIDTRIIDDRVCNIVMQYIREPMLKGKICALGEHPDDLKKIMIDSFLYFSNQVIFSVDEVEEGFLTGLMHVDWKGYCDFWMQYVDYFQAKKNMYSFGLKNALERAVQRFMKDRQTNADEPHSIIAVENKNRLRYLYEYWPSVDIYQQLHAVVEPLVFDKSIDKSFKTKLRRCFSLGAVFRRK